MKKFSINEIVTYVGTSLSYREFVGKQFRISEIHNFLDGSVNYEIQNNQGDTIDNVSYPKDIN